MKWRSMRLSLIGLGGLFLILVGLRPQALPFIPGASFSDAAVAHWPAAYHLREAVLERGEFPLWQDTILGGQPFAANPLNKTAYPLQWLALLLSPALHLNVLLVLHLLLAGLGMYRWTRTLDFPVSAALFSALAYTFAPKIIAHVGAGHLDLLYALAWWPWLMESVKRLVSPGESPAWLRVIEVGVLAGLVMLSDVRLGLFALALAAAYAVWEAASQRTIKRLLCGVPALALSAILTFSVTLPLLVWRPYLSRSAMTTADAGVFSLEFGHLVGLLLPPHSGNVETLAYLGLPVLLLAGIAVFAAPRRHIFWIIAIGLAVLYALGVNSPFWPLLTDLLPFLRWFRVPSRAWFVVILIASVLAGYGLMVLMNGVERLRQREIVRRLAIKRLATAGGLGASLFCGGFTLAALSELPATIGVGVMGVGALLGVVVLLGLYGRLPASRLAVLITLILFVDLAWTGRNWLEWRGPEDWLTHQDALVELLNTENPARIYSPNYALEQQVAAAIHLRLFYGVDPFQLSGIVDAIEQGSGVPVTAYSVVMPPLDVEADEGDDRTPDEMMLTANRDAILDTASLAEWAVSHVVTTYPLEYDRLELLSESSPYFVYRNLDYDPAVQLNEYGWPVSGGDILPDTATVGHLNQITGLSALVAGISFVLCTALLIWGVLRR